MPRIVFRVVDLPDALPPSKTDQLALGDLERHLLEDVDLTVVRVDVLQLQQLVHFVSVACSPR